ncbi:MAG: geranylgeranylglyceryl/heptaprenylglyceryl phosphate synthase [Euryarchaeota archaeon]|nr:geranylgeranylglyceryl/heptaprenylglyceryl phosphate synthase [Euryarchaeota archaeon]
MNENGKESGSGRGVFSYLRARLEAEGRLHMVLLDPDKFTPERAAQAAHAAGLAGSSAIMVGGSTGVTPQRLDRLLQAVRQATRLPTILFPGGAGGLSRHADAVYFMSLLNSRSPRFLVQEPRRGARAVRKLGLEPIPMGYLVVAPGQQVGRVGRARLIPRDRPEEAAEYALTAELFGMHLVYLEAGSGAPEPIPPEMVRRVKEAIHVPLVVGGGIRTPRQARELARAGADILVTGTLLESIMPSPPGATAANHDGGDVEPILREIISAIRGAPAIPAA